MAKPKTTKSAPKAPEMVVIPAIAKANVNLWLIGDSPLICHQWSQKARKEMLAKQQGRARAKKAPKDPEADYQESLYRREEDGHYGFPAGAFKSAAVSACRLVDGVPMTLARNVFHVTGPEFVRIYGEPRMREDMVRLNGRTSDLRYRGEFTKWAAEIPVSFESTAITLEQVINLFNRAGFGVGVGEWRPDRNGTFGRFHVAAEGEELGYIDGSAYRAA